MNRLSKEKSPYLLQHQDNPVDWFPWCEEAFLKAKAEDKPIFLSIGYSTCHWCHVMAHESFEDAEVAEILNRDFVCIKVDREERPDIDAVYMKVCQTMTGSGGWPTTIMMTPEQKPFFAGTYFPKRHRYGYPGLIELLEQVAELWHNDRENLLALGEQITADIAPMDNNGSEPSRELLDRAYKTLRRSFDHKWGGFGTAPKFPMPQNLLFLMEYGAMEMADKTLSAMARGGIFDQIGGGFSRYSTDNMWLQPHFEKMLYDNALLIIAYEKAYEMTGNEFFAEITKRTAEYILRELRSPDGACYCGQDADSDGVEGKYYIFTPEEIIEALGEAEGKEFCHLYGINEKVNIPNLIGSEEQPWDTERLRPLYEYRKSRSSLHTDDKILLSWNAWTIIALVRSGYSAEAIAIQRFIEANMTDESNRLYLRFREGEAANFGQLDDYAVYALALLVLYRETFDIYYLEQAILRAEQILKLFEDEKGGYFLTAHDAEQLIQRPKESYDGAIPSGNSVVALVLEMLAQLSGESKWREASERQLRFMAGQAEEYPVGYCFALLAMDKALSRSRELIACGENLPPELKEIQADNLNILYKSTANSQRLIKCAHFTENYPIPKQGTSWYLCENGACKMPVYSFQELNI